MAGPRVIVGSCLFNLTLGRTPSSAQLDSLSPARSHIPQSLQMARTPSPAAPHCSNRRLATAPDACAHRSVNVRASCYLVDARSTALHGFHYSTTAAGGVDWRS